MVLRGARTKALFWAKPRRNLWVAHYQRYKIAQVRVMPTEPPALPASRTEQLDPLARSLPCAPQHARTSLEPNLP